MQGVDARQWLVPSKNPGWSNKDLLAHLATGYVVRLALLNAILETGHPGVLPSADAANAKNVAERRDATVDDLIKDLVATRANALELMSRLGDNELDLVVPDDKGGWIRLGVDLLGWSGHDLDHASELAPARVADYSGSGEPMSYREDVQVQSASASSSRGR